MYTAQQRYWGIKHVHMCISAVPHALDATLVRRGAYTCVMNLAAQPMRLCAGSPTVLWLKSPVVLLQTGDDTQMGMAQASPQLLLGPGVLSDAVTAAMHAVQPGNMYWGDASAQPSPAISSQDMSADPDELHQDNGLPAQLAGRHFLCVSCASRFLESMLACLQQPLPSVVLSCKLLQHLCTPYCRLCDCILSVSVCEQDCSVY